MEVDCQLKFKALHVMAKNLGNDHNTSIWHDVWLPVGKLLNQIDIVPSITAHWVIFNIVSDDRWCLKDGELLPVWHHIQQRAVLDIHAQEMDTWCLSLTKTSEFTFSSAWNLVRHHGEKFPFFYLIWYPNHSPKMSLCLLRLESPER